MARRKAEPEGELVDLGPGSIEAAVRGDLEVLDPATPVARSLCETAFALARALDQGAGLSTAAVARQLRETLLTIAEACSDDDGAALFAQLSTPVLDATKG